MFMIKEIKFRYFWNGKMYDVHSIDFGLNRVNGSMVNGKLLQFTGLLDKNGKEICEGDIIEYSGWSKAGLETGAFSYKYQVIYDTEKFMFSVDSKMSLYNLSTLGRGKIEIIGNIYPNPELLN